jgi:sterol 3beta-glucosyltransferase
VVVPFFGDQFFWGWWVSRIGVGPVPIPRKELTAKSLAGAILAAVSDETMKQKANVLGVEIRSEDGISRAVDIIEQRYLGKPLKRS